MGERINQIEEIGKVPPSDIDAEEGILAFLISEPDKVPLAISLIRSEMFYKQNHSYIYDAIITLFQKEMAIDLTSIAYQLSAMDKLSEIGGHYALAVIISKNTHSLYHFNTYCMILVEMFIRRELITMGYQIVEKSYDGTIDIIDIKEQLLERLDILFDVNGLGKESFNDSIDKVLENIFNIQEKGFNPDLLYTHTFMDELIQIKPNNVIFIASLQKHGKTKLAIYTMHNLLKHNKDRIALLWYSMEDDKDKIIKNRISIDTHITYSQQSGEDNSFKLNTEHLEIISEAANMYRDDNVTLIDKPSKINIISSKFRTFCKQNENKINILVIDNFFIVSNLEEGLNDTVKEARVASFIQNLNASLQSQGYKALIIVLDHLKKDLFDNKLESGYRPLQGMLKGSNRKGEILTQLLLLSKPSEHQDLIADEELKPDIKIEENYYKRKEILNKLLLLENFATRNTESHSFKRIVTDLGTMEYYEMDKIYKLIKPVK